MSPVRRFTLAGDAEVEPFLAGLSARTTLVPEVTEVVERTVYDTFDWRLYDDDGVIEHQVRDDASVVVWRSLSTGEIRARFDLDGVPRFAWDLEPGPAASRLAPIVEMRALLPLTRIVTRRTTLRQVDDEDKTVARIVADEVIEPADTLAPVVEVVPLRGYDREARTLTDLLDAQIVLAGGAEDLVVTALRSSGFAPGDYTSKLRTVLDADRPAIDAWVTVLRALFSAMRTNEAGLRDDLDSEFLHDYRVAVRRTRSVLGEAGGVLPADVLDRYTADFKWLGQATGPTRDLDVFLLDTTAFQDELPPERRPDLKAFLTFLEGRQREAHHDLVAALDTDRYAELLDSWARILDEPPTPTDDEPDGARPAPAVAARRIAKAHRRMVKRGRRIDAASEPERLHDLRKDAKRLRYLLECFGSLFPSELVGPIVKDLKGVQDVLGTYQDCQVQASQLERFAQDMLDQDNVGAPAVMVIGLLVEQLERRGVAAREHFGERFEAFDRKEVRTDVRRLDPDHRDRSGHHHHHHHEHHHDATDAEPGLVPRPEEEPEP